MQVRPRILVAVALLLALGVLAAPALSLRPYRPKPVDFSMAGDLAPKMRSGHALFSRPLRAPKRFNLVGLTWRGSRAPGVQVRTRRDGGEWTRWTALDAENADGPDPGSREAAPSGVSSPTWTGEADWVQYRLSRPVHGVRLHFENVRGTATAADRARTAVRRSVNSALLAVTGVPGAQAAEGPPAMITRDGWGASACPPREVPQEGVVKAAFIHHTVSANDYSRAEAASIVLGICRYHRNVNGWNDIGYNFLVSKYGDLFEGRAGGIDAPIVGAQAQGYNAQTTGIASLGTHTTVGMTSPELQATARLIRWKLPLHGAPTSGATTLVSAGGDTNLYSAGTHVRVQRISGHRDVDSTECPGGALYSQLRELRGLVGSINPGGIGTVLSARLSARRVGYRRRVKVRGRLKDVHGHALGGKRVYVQVRSGQVFRNVTHVTTGSDGRYSAAVRPRVNRTLRARFRGSRGLLGSSSRRSTLLVRPVIGLDSVPSGATAGQPVALSGVVRPHKRRLLLVVQRLEETGFHKVLTRSIRVRRGRWHTAFTPHGHKKYRFYLVAVTDRSTIRGSTRRRVLAVR